MKADTAPHASVIDALTAGLSLAARRPALLAIPVLVDLGVWLAPRLSVETLLRQLLAVWEALLAAFYTAAQRAAMADTITAMRDALDGLARSIDLTTAVTVGWLAPASAVVDVQATRLKLISDAVLAPVGLGLSLPQVAPPPWQTAAVEVTSVWLVLLIVAMLWAVGMVLTTFYMRSTATALVAESTVAARRSLLAPGSARYGVSTAAPPLVGPPVAAPPAVAQPLVAPAASETPGSGVGRDGTARGLPLAFGPLLLRFAVLSLVLGVAAFLMRVPLVLAMMLAVFSGNVIGAGVFVLSGGLTLWFMLWFLSAAFFASEAILFEGQRLGPAFWQALLVARASGWRTFGLIALVNVIALGFRAVWGLMGQTPLGVLLSILGNAYLVTGLLLAIFIYYSGLRRELQLVRPGRRVIK